MSASQYLNRLGLDKAADERAIKRAYARELKQIDQEADAAGFQALRQAYEMALQWVKHKPAGVSFAPAVTVPVLPVAILKSTIHTRPAAPVAAAPARNTDTGESPQRLGQAVFDAFLDVCGEMVAQGNGRDSLLWRKHLQSCANDERLLNITARAHFEFLVARLLADGWRAGHEGLFVAARQVFAWEKDRRRLMEFGQLGIWLSQAIDECEMFTYQKSGDCSGQTDAVTRVRQDTAPSKNELITHVPHLRNMVARFPAWTAVIASRERILQWMEMEQAIPKWRRRMRITSTTSSTEKSGRFSWWKFALIFMVIRALASVFGSSSTSNQPPPWNPPRLNQSFEQATEREKEDEAIYKRAAGKFYMPPGTRKLDPLTQQAQSVPAALAPTRPKGRAPNDAEMKAISKRVQFQWPHTATGTYKVEFNVELDERGAIANLTKKTASGLPVLDKSVEDAIRASAPFGAQISRRFGLFYTSRHEPAKEKAPMPDTATPDPAE
ncbi:hypothetical protein CSQ96_15255 [Janthinobacterium sp. BJB412]|nr:hypothetical protein CSQ96_15255 [Janthinobacterium sp. BJB412]